MKKLTALLLTAAMVLAAPASALAQTDSSLDESNTSGAESTFEETAQTYTWEDISFQAPAAWEAEEDGSQIAFYPEGAEDGMTTGILFMGEESDPEMIELLESYGYTLTDAVLMSFSAMGFEDIYTLPTCTMNGFTMEQSYFEVEDDGTAYTCQLAVLNDDGYLLVFMLVQSEESEADYAREFAGMIASVTDASAVPEKEKVDEEEDAYSVSDADAGDLMSAVQNCMSEVTRMAGTMTLGMGISSDDISLDMEYDADYAVTSDEETGEYAMFMDGGMSLYGMEFTMALYTISDGTKAATYTCTNGEWTVSESDDPSGMLDPSALTSINENMDYSSWTVEENNSNYRLGLTSDNLDLESYLSLMSGLVGDTSSLSGMNFSIYYTISKTDLTLSSIEIVWAPADEEGLDLGGVSLSSMFLTMTFDQLNDEVEDITVPDEAILAAGGSIEEPEEDTDSDITYNEDGDPLLFDDYGEISIAVPAPEDIDFVEEDSMPNYLVFAAEAEGMGIEVDYGLYLSSDGYDMATFDSYENDSVAEQFKAFYEDASSFRVENAELSNGLTVMIYANTYTDEYGQIQAQISCYSELPDGNFICADTYYVVDPDYATLENLNENLAGEEALINVAEGVLGSLSV